MVFYMQLLHNISNWKKAQVMTVIFAEKNIGGYKILKNVRNLLIIFEKYSCIFVKYVLLYTMVIQGCPKGP